MRWRTQLLAGLLVGWLAPYECAGEQTFARLRIKIGIPFQVEVVIQFLPDLHERNAHLFKQLKLLGINYANHSKQFSFEC